MQGDLLEDTASSSASGRPDEFSDILILPRLRGGNIAIITPPGGLASPRGYARAEGGAASVGKALSHEQRGSLSETAPADAAVHHFSDLLSSLPGTGPGGSLEAVLRARLRQIQKYGHTPEQDAAAPLRKLTTMLHAAAVRLANETKAAGEDEMFDVGLDVLAKRLANIAAMALAAIDRVEAGLDARAAADTRDAQQEE
jgi:hypothetical protein